MHICRTGCPCRLVHIIVDAIFYVGVDESVKEEIRHRRRDKTEIMTQPYSHVYREQARCNHLNAQLERYCDCHVGFVHDLRGHRARQGYKARFAELLQINRRSKRLAKAANRRKITFEDWDKDFFVISVGKKSEPSVGWKVRGLSGPKNCKKNPKCLGGGLSG